MRGMAGPSQNAGQIESARILIVDDEPQNIAILVKLLREKGYAVRAARDADHALQTLEIETVDLILLDIRMPKMSGFEFCDKLKQEQRTAAIPVIFLTALNEVEDKVRGLELGAVDYITKPFNLDEVLARVVRQLKLRSEHLVAMGNLAAHMQSMFQERPKLKGYGEYRKSGLDTEKRKEICRLLQAYFEEESPYLDEGLDVETIAGKLKVTRHNLSEAVNMEMNRSIAYLINRYRIDHFCELSQQQPDATILELLFQCGYNSKSVFNRWFKTIRKTTPKKFRKALSPGAVR